MSAAANIPYAVGSIVRARGREWVVLPESTREADTLWLRPLGGTDDEVTGLFLPLEPVTSASFPAPDPTRELGNARSLGLLRDALRLGARAGAGPFRCLARLGIDARPYQFVPLLLALRQEAVRLLIADGVGVGKTIEALLIARELLDRSEIDRIAVLCPPHLADGWVTAMREQFHIDAVPVLSGTAARLERTLGHGESLFDRHPFVVVSMDFIKSENRRAEFLRACPGFVIVDEAHGCAASAGGRARQQRHQLLQKLAADPARHLVLVTATPHSGDEDTFRSLLSLLDPTFRDLPGELSGEGNRPWRERLARHLVQRRRADLRGYMDADTPFPDRLTAEHPYDLSPAYRAFMDKVLAWCRERVYDPALDARRQRVQWWSALALLRAISSSPRAASATLRARTASLGATTPEEADALGRRAVLDQEEAELDGGDATPGSQTDDDEGDAGRRHLLDLAREAERLEGTADRKAASAVALVKQLLAEGHHPIVFCRFLATVDYLGEILRKGLGREVTVECITGALHPEDRAQRIDAMASAPKRVLVCTDCLSEGINLQGSFDAVVHYDLAWNPTRHEQREGRVDRFGQTRPVVKTVTVWGRDNPVDGVVLDVLLRKHESIRKTLGVSVPVPLDTDALVEALLEGGVLRKGGTSKQLDLFAKTKSKEVDLVWDSAAARETASRSLFAQHGVRVEEVRSELAAARKSLGDGSTVERFVRVALQGAGVNLPSRSPTVIHAGEVPLGLRDALGISRDLTVSFDGNAPGAVRLHRTHPVVAGLAGWVTETALDPLLDGPARRCGVVRTRLAARRAVVLLLRVRMQIIAPRGGGAGDDTLLAEDLATVGFTGSGDAVEPLDDDTVEALLGAAPDDNVAPDIARAQVRRALDALPAWSARLDAVAEARSKALLDAHRRVRQVARLAVRGFRVQPWLPADVLGLFVFLPAGGVA